MKEIKSLSLLELRLSKLAILVGDALAFALAFFLSTWLALSFEASAAPMLQRYTTWMSTQEPLRYVSWAGVALMGLMALLMGYQHYSDRRTFWDQVGDFVRLLMGLAMLDMTVVALTHWNASRLWWLLSWVTLFFTLLLMRRVTRHFLQLIGYWSRPTVIIGDGNNALEAAAAIKSEPGLGLEVVGFMPAESRPGPSNPDQMVQLQGLPLFQHKQVAQLAKQPGFQWVIALEHADAEIRERWIRELTLFGAQEVAVIPAMRGVPLHGTNMSHFFSHEVAMLRMRNNLRRWPARLAKRVFDTLTALVLLVLLSPLMLLIALLIRRDGGSVLFAHSRVGKKGKVFKCYKFRTMVVDAEQQLEQLLQQQTALRTQWENERKLSHDPRINRWGQFLRTTSLDELPQLFNVIRGEMSLVGPRPIVAAELSKYGDEVGYYLMVRPGMTGLWQVSGRSDLDYDIRVYLDTWYVKNWSLWHDQIILFKTIGVVLRRAGAY